MNGVTSEERKYWVAFSRISRIGAVRAGMLQAHFSSMAEAWKASAAELMAAGLDRGTVTSIVNGRGAIDPDAEMERLQKSNIKAYCWLDEEYPPRLKEIDDKPPVLYVRGTLLPDDEWAVAMVGTRRATPYGRQAAEHFATDLSRHRITIVSGLARGIDAVAHRAALAGGGRTIAVLACGLDMVYPPEHAKLAQEIIQHGCLVSDYPVGTQPRSEYFPRRNRILSGISLGVLVVEGDVDSGALITARMALDQNREVFAVPGSIYSPTYRGANKLIQEGEAKLVASAEDILEELNLTMATHQMELREVLPTDPTEARLLKVISNQPIHIDEVQRASGLPIATVSGALAMLELKGMVRQIGPMSFVRARDAGAVAYSVSK
ncbi:MAG TPA: DNA-processing protein DprA [Dehalococcoidia bacterium]|nr:DNA-processing protein DprA [Dehalococcoidia bacterium]